MRLVTAIAASIALAGCVSDAEARSGLGLGHREAVSSGVDTAASRPGAASGITAESRYGHGIVSGPVRESARGRLEVRLPGGTWLECGRSCSETLRRETVDFWESRNNRNNPPDGPAYLNWRW